MKSIFYKLLLSAVLPGFISSCSDQENSTSTDDKAAIQVSAGIHTRAINDQWSANDAIGITMLDEKGEKIIESYTNYQYATNGNGDFTPIPQNHSIYFPQDGSKVTFKSYYPYQSGLADILAIPGNVSKQDNLPAIDLMTAEHQTGDC